MSPARKSIFVRLGLIITTTVVVIMSLHSAYTYFNKRAQTIEAINDLADESAHTLEKNISGLIAAYAVNEYEKLVVTEMEKGDAFAILVDDYNMGRIMGGESYLTGWIRAEDGSVIEYMPDSPHQARVLESCCLVHTHRIYQNGEDVIGDVSIYISDKAIDSELNKTIVSTLINALAISLLHILTLFSAIRVFVLKPVVEITETIKSGDEHGMPLQDIPEQGPAEVTTLARTMNRMIDSIRKANEAKDEFMASMSHELRTPLTSIIGNSELLYENLSTAEERELLNAIKVAGKNQLALISDILDTSKIESGNLSIKESPYDLSVLLDEIRQMFLHRAHEADIGLTIQQENDEPNLLMGDEFRINQILINLVSNAFKFTDQGEVKLTTKRLGEYLVFKIHDTGIGIEPDQQDQLFQRFKQIDGKISRRFGGTGLGLYISDGLADLMGGYIDVSSAPGKGSVFQLVLPYRSTEISRREAEATSVIPSQAIDQKLTGKVLVAEDTLAIQLLEKRILENMGLVVTVANNGQEAVDLVANHHFDLVLMDMQMPVMDGIEATQALRDRGKTLPIIALTANVMPRHRELFQLAGCNDFLEKPIDKQMLRKVLAKYLEAAHSGQSG